MSDDINPATAMGLRLILSSRPQKSISPLSKLEKEQFACLPCANKFNKATHPAFQRLWVRKLAQTGKATYSQPHSWEVKWSLPDQSSSDLFPHPHLCSGSCASTCSLWETLSLFLLNAALSSAYSCLIDFEFDPPLF